VTGRRKLLRAPERSAGILAAAAREFAAGGYAATTVDGIAAAAITIGATVDAAVLAWLEVTVGAGDAMSIEDTALRLARILAAIGAVPSDHLSTRKMCATCSRGSSRT
jgi:hypothetical protein